MKKVLSLYFILMCLLELSAQVKSLNYNLSSDRVEDLIIQNNGLTWIGTDEGLNVFYDNEKQVYYSSIEDSLSLLNSKINKLFNSSDEVLFVLSQGGVSVFNRSSQNFKQIQNNAFRSCFRNMKIIKKRNFGLLQKNLVFTI